MSDTEDPTLLIDDYEFMIDVLSHGNPLAKVIADDLPNIEPNIDFSDAFDILMSKD
jgi:hypothetical protein